MKAATLSQSTSGIRQPAPYPLEGLTKTSTRKTAMLVGLCFLVATFTFAIGSALILTIVAIGGYFLTSRTRWNASVLPVYAVSVAAGLILSCALWWLVPRNVSVLGLIGYPVFLSARSWPCST